MFIDERYTLCSRIFSHDDAKQVGQAYFCGEMVDRLSILSKLSHPNANLIFIFLHILITNV